MAVSYTHLDVYKRQVRYNIKNPKQFTKQIRTTIMTNLILNYKRKLAYDYDKLLNELRREDSYSLTQRNPQDMKNNIYYRDDHINNPP